MQQRRFPGITGLVAAAIVCLPLAAAPALARNGSKWKGTR